MKSFQRLVSWLETHWIVPAYAGWLIAGLALFFFGAATNTMAGWLYVISGIMAAVLAIASIWPRQILRDIEVTRSPIEPVSQGEPLILELWLENCTKRDKPLLQITDVLPKALGSPIMHSIEQVPAGNSLSERQNHPLLWQYQQPTQRRGIYHWQVVQLRTAAPLGLCWGRRQWQLPAKAVVYPLVLPLDQCPLIDQLGRDEHAQQQALRLTQTSTEGITRTLRPYRWGDSTRLIHWRSSARYGDLRLRELEVLTGGQAVVIGLDTLRPTDRALWQGEDFEQAVIAAASLYRYAVKQGMTVSLWTAQTGLLTGNQQMLEVLAAVQPIEPGSAPLPRGLPLIWLTCRPGTLETLPAGSRWLMWNIGTASTPERPGRVIQSDQSLQQQLQSPLVH